MKERLALLVVATLAITLFWPSNANAQSFIQANFNYSGSTGNTLIPTSNWPSFVSTAGNTVVVYARCSGSSTNVFTVSDAANTTGWQGPFYNDDGNSNERSAMFYIQPTGNIVTPYVSFSTACSNASIIALELSDISASPLDAGPVFFNHSAGVTSGTTAALTTTNPNDILVVCMDPASADQATYTAGSGYTLPKVTSTARSVCEYKIVSATQSAVHAGVGWSAASSYNSVFFALKGSGSGSVSQTVDFQESCTGANMGTGSCGRWLVSDGGPPRGIAPYTFAPSFDPGGGFPMYAILSPTAAFQDDYFHVKMSAPDFVSHFTYCTNWQIPNSADLTKFQAIETDFHQNTIDLHAYTGGVQFLSATGGGPAVRLFDIGTNAWHPVSGLTMPLTDTNWHSLCYSFTNDHTAHTTTYTSITIDGSTTPLSVTYNATTTGDLPVIGVAVQLDGDSTMDSYKLQVQNWSISFN